MPNKKVLKSVPTSCARLKLTATINLVLILHLLADIACACRRSSPMRWAHIANEIDHLPLAVKTGVVHFFVSVLLFVGLLENQPDDYPLLFTMGLASYVTTYCLATIASRPSGTHRPRRTAHWVGENVITQPGRK